MSKKLTSVVLAMIFALGCLTLTASAAEEKTITVDFQIDGWISGEEGTGLFAVEIASFELTNVFESKDYTWRSDKTGSYGGHDYYMPDEDFINFQGWDNSGEWRGLEKVVAQEPCVISWKSTKNIPGRDYFDPSIWVLPINITPEKLKEFEAANKTYFKNANGEWETLYREDTDDKDKIYFNQIGDSVTLQKGYYIMGRTMMSLTSFGIIEVKDAADSTPNPPVILVNGEVLTVDQPAVIESGRTLVPVANIARALGADVDWNAAARVVTITKDGKVIKLTIDSNKVLVDGDETTIDVPARIIGGRTMAPVNFVSTQLGANVTWDGDKREVIITTK